MVGFYNYTVWMTYLSLLSGSIGIYFAMSGNPFIGIICLLTSGFCDMFDGKIARTKIDRTQEEKSFGIQIDSLTDLVCFGVLPIVIGYNIGMNKAWALPIFALFIICGMIRLAYYNVLEINRQAVESNGTNSYFLGIPITMSSVIFPLVYCFKMALNDNFYILYSIIMVLLACFFVIKIKVPKLRAKYSIFAALTGIIIFCIVYFGRK